MTRLSKWRILAHINAGAVAGSIASTAPCDYLTEQPSDAGSKSSLEFFSPGFLFCNLADCQFLILLFTQLFHNLRREFVGIGRESLRRRLGRMSGKSNGPYGRQYVSGLYLHIERIHGRKPVLAF